MEISSITAQAQWKFPASLLTKLVEISSVTAHQADGNFQRHCSGPMEISNITAQARWKFPASLPRARWKFPASLPQDRWKFPASLLRPDGNFQRHCPRPPQREFYSIICCKPNNEQKSKSNSWVCLCHVGVGKLGPGGHWELDLIVKTWVGEIRR